MSSHYVLSSPFNRYDIKLPRCTSPLPSAMAPPSYSQVLLEKLQSQQQENQTTAIITAWEKKLKEIKSSVKDAKRQMYKVQDIMQDIQYRCIRLECKNEYLLEHLKQTSELALSLSNPVHNKEMAENDDSLSRMNGSVETLIEEAQKSLTSHFSLKPDPIRLRRARSYPCFTELNYPENRRKSHHLTQNGDTLMDIRKKYQKARYFHSQWRLVNTMRQLLESVQHTTSEQKVIQQKQKVEQPETHVHIHHHHHYHYSSDIPSIPAPNNTSFIQKWTSQTSITAKNATTSLLQYVGIMPSGDKLTPQNNGHPPVKYRTMFLATMMMMQTFDPLSKPTMRGNKILRQWYQHPTLKRLFPIWLPKAHLVFYLVRCFRLK